MPIVTVVNHKTMTSNPLSVYRFRIDRGTPVGNPYAESIFGREECIRLYKLEINECIKNKKNTRFLVYSRVITYLEDIAIKFNEGEDIELVCWCAPLACHGDWLKQIILGLAKKINNGSWTINN